MKILAALVAATTTVAMGWSTAQAGDVEIEPFGFGWIVVENQPCQVWYADPEQKVETVAWTGTCIDGKASGEGELNFDRGKFIGKGIMRAGKMHGRWRMKSFNGSTAVGEYHEGLPHGLSPLPFRTDRPMTANLNTLLSIPCLVSSTVVPRGGEVPRQRPGEFLVAPEVGDSRDPRSRFAEAPSQIREGVRVPLQPPEAVRRDVRRSGGEPPVTIARRRASKSSPIGGRQEVELVLARSFAGP